MSSNWRYLSGSWLTLQPGQRVWLRPSRKPGDIVAVDVAAVLPTASDGSGAGIRDQSGRDYRRFDWDLALTEPDELAAQERRGLVKMPSRRRSVILTRSQLVIIAMYANGATVTEAATVLGISRWTAYSYLVQAKRQYADLGYDVSTKQLLLDELERETPAVGSYYAVTRPARPALPITRHHKDLGNSNI
ncbi:helix-turn-helix transcriptional regulator [Schumannella soli]|uniref:Uncharacterized protein n=1 Tax=Schumannella soli TaxID=2590779 RepID=A0A506Y7K4_9MICO|nr:hypothetical protein [Schumannella soli]TPW78072.1 hypothetical protein FJ657_05445 [Schumannella soli]